jgi:hypothetical protein
MKLYTITTPDPLGEYPVQIIDQEDLPGGAVIYPGFDVYMANLTGVIEVIWDDYTALYRDPRYAKRMRWHATQHPSSELAEDGMASW